MRIGELFSGYGGLGMGVQTAMGGEVVWHSDIDPGACKILAHRYPGVPNLGDVTAVDWSRVEPVDVLTGGTPCQDLSHAGKRGGMTEGTRSNLWVAMRDAIAAIRPSIVVWENVGGAASASADSEVEPCAGCMGDAEHRGPSLRALGRVVGDLSSLGYVGRVGAIRAADVGAPHGRLRYFLSARNADRTGRQGQRRGRAVAGVGTAGSGGGAGSSHADAPDVGHERGGRPRDGWAGPEDGGLLPTPRATRGGSNTETVELLPTPRATDGTKGGPGQRGTSGDLMLPSAVTSLTKRSVDLIEDGVAGGVLAGVDVDQRGQVTDGLEAQGDVSHEPMVSRPATARNKADENSSRDFTLLPTPAVNDMGEGKTPDAWDEWTARMKAEHANGNGHGKSLAIEAQRLLPTPTTQAAKHDADDGGPGTLDDSNLWSVAARIAKGQDDGLPAEGGPGEELRDVRDAADPQEVRQRQARGPGRVPAQEVLQPELREHQDDGDAVGSRAQSGEAQEASVRGLRGDRGSHPRPPQGPELAQRRPGEPADAVRVVSSEVALAGGPGATAGGEPLVDWGVYTDAIRRWEQVLGRPAPPPTQLSRKGTPQLSPRFSEFLMGLPDGWVTDVPGITRNEALRALGNGVVPQQATAALRYLLTVEVPA